MRLARTQLIASYLYGESSMALDAKIRDSIVIPAICAPMFLVSGPDLVREACKAGLIGGLPRLNARNIEELESWLADIRRDLDTHTALLRRYGS